MNRVPVCTEHYICTENYILPIKIEEVLYKSDTFLFYTLLLFYYIHT